jgi:cytochrome c oxidase subunit II
VPPGAAFGLAIAAADVSSIFAPVSAPADASLRAALLVLAIAAGIFVVVGGLLAYGIVVFRRRPDDDGSEPPQVYGSDQIELAWTVIPILIVVVLCLVTARTVYDVQAATRPPGALDVTIVGHQWWWEIRYPALDVVTANELHVPVSEPADPKPTYLTLESADVVHSFWVPRLSGKTDLIPNRRNVMWIEPREPGLFRGQCAEFCGTQHAHMLLRVYVHPRAEFERWVAAQRQPAVRAPDVAAGREVFETTACVNCHTVRGTGAAGSFGPDLTHLMSRDTLAAGAAPLTRESLDDWIANPNRVKPGALMPAMQLDAADREHLVAYLATLH